MDDYREEKKFTRGLYRGVRISIRTLDIIIGVGVAVIVLLLIWGISNGGYTVTFDSRGGSDVESQSYEYGESLLLPEAPSREGYTFEGWSLQESCQTTVDETYEISGDTRLYACWQSE